jgi:YhcH/YjgK/YiaL family protein
MKKIITSLMVLISLFGLLGMKGSSDPSSWSEKKIDKWFAKSEWLAGWKVSPDPSINKKEMAISWFKNKERWEKAFTFLKENDLSKLEAKRFDIDGDNLFATISDYTTKDSETANFEAHRKYIDIQYVISGKEIMNVAPLTSRKDLITAYDASKDIEFFTVNKYADHLASPSNFFIFFPVDAHRPQIKDGNKSQVRKVVIKVRVD